MVERKSQSPSVKLTLRAPTPSQALSAIRVPGLHVVYSPNPKDIGRTLFLRASEKVEVRRCDSAKPTDSVWQLSDGYLSERHATVECVYDSTGGQRWLVCDLQSTNGVFVNGRRCTREVVSQGDVLRIGATVCVFDFADRSFDADVDRKPGPEFGPEFGLVGWSSAIADVRREIRQIGDTSHTALIFGETGAGKELVARAIHDASSRRRGPFVAVNCSVISESLAASELFGHAANAFTGAATVKQDGYFQKANRGTLFLDEIDKTSVAFQRLLLRVLEDNQVYPVGCKTPEKVDVRVIAAANQDLISLIEDKRFQEDVYYRLNKAYIDVAPLRNRRVDIPRLVDHFLKAESLGSWQTVVARDPGAPWYIADLLEKLCCYDWPGNVRDLSNEVSRMVRAIQASAKAGRIPLVPPPESCFSHPVVVFRRQRGTVKPVDLDPEQTAHYHQVFSDPVRLRAAIEQEAEGNIKKFAELSGPYLNKSWDAARRLIYRVLGERPKLESGK